jgi:Protein of unknown function (DUF3107)
MAPFARRNEELTVDVRIGITYSPKEIEVELPDDTDAAALKSSIEAAVVAGGVLWLTDRKGRQVGVAVEKMAYVEVGTATDKGRIGFGS